MTNPNPTPTAAEALALAWKYASAMTASTADIARAEVLLGIASEIRQEQQFRAAERRRDAVGALGRRPHDHLSLTKGQLVPDLGAFGVTYGGEPAYGGETAVDRTVRIIREAGYAERPAWDSAVTQVVNEPAATQVIWTVGDKAQCRHCHTPIELCTVAVEVEGEPPAVWRHKYTGQATCAVATMAGRLEESGEVRPAEATYSHTFAEPDPRG